MSKIDKAVWNAKTKGQMMFARINEKASEKATGDETLIIKIMLMVVAVVLVLLFRNTMEEIITYLLEFVKTKVESMYYDPTPTPGV